MPFLAFEGLDGSGKSTLMDRLEMSLKKNQIKIVRTREPGGTKLGDEIRQLILRTSGEAPTPRTELLLYQASRAQHVDQVIKPALSRGDWVLSDRFSASSIAFQAGGRAITEDDVEKLNHFSTQGTRPELTVLLDLPVEKSIERRNQREQKTGERADRMESEKNDFHQRVRDSFLKQAKQNPQTWLVLDAEKSTDQLMEILWEDLRRRGWVSLPL
ncbi:MAG: dTMP kinase [Bdellovibrionota bacterium]